MRKFLLYTFTFILAVIILKAEPDTLSYWDRSGTISAYSNTTYPWQVAHFYPDAPCYIHSVTIYCYGNAGKASVFIAGQEAGSSVPEVVSATGRALRVLNDVQLNAQTNTAVPTVIQLDPPIYIDGNQFFVGLIDLPANTYLATDQTQVSPWCDSKDGGTYLHQALLRNDQEFQGWQLGGYSFLIDAAIDYPTRTSARHFRDITEDYSLPLDLSKNSIAAADLDGDGFQELLITGRLFKNDEGNNFEEITSAAGLSGSPTANAFVDMDNDGDLDILFINEGTGNKSKIFLNNGDGTFEGHDLNIPELKSVTCFSIADINNDKYPDLFIGQLWKTYPVPEPNYLLINNGKNDFVDSTKILYPDYDGTYNYPNAAWDPDKYVYEKNRNSRGSEWVDFDNDGDLDLYVTNYFLQWDELYQNNGNGTFTDIIAQKNIDVNKTGHNHGTGVDWCDYDNDGDMDLLLSQFAHPRFIKEYGHRPLTIYKNSGSPDYNFIDTYDPETFSSKIGIGYEETYAGAVFGDVNNNGYADFLATTYYGCRFIDFYMQNEDNTFENKTFEFGLDGIVTGEDANFIDFDNDGKLDLAMSIDRKFRLFKNYYDLNYDWLAVDLQGDEKSGKWNIIGARVKVYTKNNKTYMQEISCGRGQKMQKPYRLHFGLGLHDEIEKVAVRWPHTDQFEEFFNIEKNKIVNIIQGEGGELQIPGITLLSSPADQSSNIDISTEKLTWNSVSKATKYHIVISEDEEFTKIVSEKNDLTKTEYSISDLEGKKTYYWKVQAGNSLGFGEWSEVWSFTTKETVSETPDPPLLVSPDDGAIEVDRSSVFFQWQVSEKALTYNLQASKTIDFAETVLDITGLTATKFPISDLDVNTSYYWRVRAWNKVGFGDWSEIRMLTTDDSEIDYPTAPVLLSPDNNAENVAQNAFLTWDVGMGASSYHVKVSTYYTVNKDLVIDTTDIRQTRFPVVGLAGETKYYWLVYSVNSRGESEEASPTRSFTTGIFSSVEDLDISPNGFYLSEIQPNPANSFIEFNLGIKSNSYVDLNIYNIQGRKVAEIINKQMVKGTYKIHWNTDKIISGIYYCQLVIGQYSQTKKIIVIK